MRDAACAARLVDSIRALVGEQGHAPESVEVVGGATVVARLSTAAIGGSRRGGGGPGLGAAAGCGRRAPPFFRRLAPRDAASPHDPLPSNSNARARASAPPPQVA